MCEGLFSYCMTCRLVLESVNMPNHGSCLCISEATWLATSSALVLVCVSSRPDASM